MMDRDALFAETGELDSQPELLAGDAGRQSATSDFLHAPKNYLALLIVQAFISL
jgi:hypothetical protein